MKVIRVLDSFIASFQGVNLPYTVNHLGSTTFFYLPIIFFFLFSFPFTAFLSHSAASHKHLPSKKFFYQPYFFLFLKIFHLSMTSFIPSLFFPKLSLSTLQFPFSKSSSSSIPSLISSWFLLTTGISHVLYSVPFILPVPP